MPKKNCRKTVVSTQSSKIFPISGGIRAFGVRRGARGNIFAMLFAAVALTGVLASVGMQTLTGPVTTITRVTQKNIADTQLLMNAKIIISAAVTGTLGGDADTDGIIEPAAYVAAGGGETPPVGGGYLPTTLGLSLTDPWGTKYGYCVWDHGTTNSSANRLDGDNTGSAPTQPVIAVIAAGPDKAFQTTCSAYSSGPISVTKGAGSDDLILKFSYNEASASSNGLWTLNTSDQTKAELKDSGGTANVTIDRATGIGDFAGITTSTLAAKTDNVAMDGGFQLDTDGNVTTCGAGDGGTLRYNATTKKIEICDGAGTWNAAGADLWLTDNTNIWRLIGNVGIGTATPSAKLDVSGAANVSSDLGVGGAATVGGNFTVNTDAISVVAASKFVGIGKAVPTVALDVAGDAYLTGKATVLDDLVVDTSTLFVDASADMVGVGTAAPAHLFDVIGTSSIGPIGTMDFNNALVRIQENPAGPNLYMDGNTIVGDAGLIVGTLSNTDVSFLANEAEVMRVTGGGLVGIGTPVPNEKLEVVGNIRISDGSALQFGDAGNAVTGNSATDIMTFSTGGATRVTLDATGNVGVGTTSPAAQLDVAGGIKIGGHSSCTGSGNNGTIRYDSTIKKMQLCVDGTWASVSSIDQLDDIGDVDASSPAGNEVLAWDSVGGVWKPMAIGSLGNATIAVPGADGSIQFKDGTALGADASDFHWDKTNNRLGIGNNAPVYSLDVVGDGISLRHGAYSGTLTVRHTANNTIQFTNTGIGVFMTAGPSNILDFGGQQIRAGLRGGYFSHYQPLTGVALQTQDGRVQLGMGTGGDVGIGVASPLSKLDVSGAIKLGTQATCDGGGANNGTIRFDGTDLQMCRNGEWKSFSQSGGIATGNVPDALDCGVTGYRRVLYLTTTTATQYIYQLISGGSAIGMQVAYAVADGSHVSTTNTAGWANATGCDGKDFATLTSENRAFFMLGGGGVVAAGGAPQDATYITQVPHADLPNEQALSTLSTGVVKVTTGTGVLSSGAVDLSGAEATGTLAAARFPALTGDVTTSAGSLATTIANDAVSFSKLQNINPDKLLGRAAGGVGDAEEIGLGSGLAFSAGNLTYTESDPQVGTLTNGKFCVASGSAIDCTTDTPTTNASGSGTEVQFRDSSGGFDSDPTFSYDKTNHRLGIGTAAPASLLHVKTASASGIRLSRDGVDTQYLELSLSDFGSHAIVGAGSRPMHILNDAGQSISLGASGSPVVIGGYSPLASAVLDVNSTTKGFLPPRMTTAQRDAITSPATGLTVYNTTTNALNVYNGTAWVSAGSAGSAAADKQVLFSDGGTVAGNAALTFDKTSNLLALNSAKGLWNDTNVNRYENLAVYRGATPVTGAMKVTLPSAKKGSSTFLSIKIKGFNYVANANLGSWELLVSGYNFGTTWHDYGAQLTGGAPFDRVRLGNDGTSDVIILGTTSTSWAYPVAVVAEVITSGTAHTGWDSGWSISTISSETGLANLVEPIMQANGRKVFSAVAAAVPATTDTSYGALSQFYNGQFSRWGMIDDGSGIGGRGGYIQNGYTGSPLNYEFYINPLGGNVGVGTTDPQAALDVAGGVRVGADATCTAAKAGMLAMNGGALSVCLNSGSWAVLSSSTGGVSAAGSVTGAVQFRGSTGSLAADDTAFIWDDTNNRLGIGTATPSTLLDVNGTMTVGGTNGQGTINVNNTTGNLRGALYTDGTAFFIASSGGSSPIQFRTAAANRMIIDTAGNVGIGTTTPSSRLHVAGGTAIIEDTANPNQTILTLNGRSNGGQFPSILKIDQTNGAAANQGVQIEFGGRDSAAGGYSGAAVRAHYADINTTTAATELAFMTSNSKTMTEKVRIDKNGNVGIGTSTPSDKLTIRDTTAATLKFDNGTYSTTLSQGNSFTFTLNATADLDLKTSRGGGLMIQTDGSIIRYWGIGAGNRIFQVPAPITASHDGYFGFATVGSTGNYKAMSAVYTDNNTSGVAFSTKASGTDVERMRITSDGKIGIATSSPSYLLDVNGTVGAPSISVQYGDGNAIDNGILLRRTGYGGNAQVGAGLGIGFLNRSAGGLWSTDYIANKVYAHDTGAGTSTTGYEFAVHDNQITSAAPVVAMTINGKKVGIGTTTPANPLHIYSTATGSSSLVGVRTLLQLENNTGWGAPSINFKNDTTTGDIKFGSGSDVGTVNQAFMFNIGGAHAFLIDDQAAGRLIASGQLGIGYTDTVNPAVRFYHAGAASQQGVLELTFNPDSSGYLKIGKEGSGSAVDELMRVTAVGSVGIGTTSPQSKLDVTGGARVGADAVCSAAKAGMLAWNSNTLQVCTDAGTFTNIATSGGAGASASGTAGYVQVSDGSGGFTTSGTTAGEQFFWDNTNKRLGIGTSTPSWPLDVTGNSRVLGQLGVNIAPNSDNAQFMAQPSADINHGILAYSGRNGQSGNLIEARYSGSSTNFNLLKVATGNGNTPVLIVRSSGDVGIGTASPSERLHVTGGNFRVDGNSAMGGTAVSPNNILTLAANLNDPTTYYSAISASRGLTLTAHNNQPITGGSFATAMGNNAFNATNILRGTMSRVSHNGTGVVSDARGVEGQVYNTAAGSINAASSVRATTQNLVAGGNITNAYGFNYDIPFNNGTIANTYGVYVGDITTGTQTNTPYAFYAADAGARNYFAGNVGIGTASPSTLLHLYGGAVTATIQSTTNTAQLDLTNTGTTARFQAANNDLAILLGGTERMRINSSGNVGVGTTAEPLGTGSRKVEIAGTADGTSNYGSLALKGGSGGNWYAGSLDYYGNNTLVSAIRPIMTGGGNTADLLLYTANAGVLAERARITSGGTLQVGAVNGSVNGDVKVYSYNTSAPVTLLTLTNTGNTIASDAKFLLNSTTINGTVAEMAAITADKTAINTSDLTADLVFSTTNAGTASTEKMRIKGDGSISIGAGGNTSINAANALSITTSNNNSLTLQTLSNNGGVVLNTYGGSSIVSRNTTVGATVYLMNVSQNGGVGFNVSSKIVSGTDHELRFNSGGSYTKRFYFGGGNQAGGQAGTDVIISSGPQGSSTARSGDLILYAEDTTGSGRAGNILLQNDGTTTYSGNVGIGNASPLSKLDVAGGARVGADAVCSAAKAGMLAWNSNVLQVCTDAGTFTDLADSSGLIGGGGGASGGAGYVQVSDGSGGFTTSGTMGGQQFFWDNTNKRLGIGTASPDSALVVNRYDPTSGYGARLSSTFTAVPATSSNGGSVSNVSVNSGASDARDYYGGVGQIEVQGGNAYSGMLVGQSAVADYTGSGSASTMMGSTVLLRKYTGASTLTSLFGYRVLNLINSAGTITNTYGVYVGDITTGTQTNTPYAFYAADAGARNYFAGNVGIGDTAPNYRLSVLSSNDNIARFIASSGTSGVTMSGSANNYSNLRVFDGGGRSITVTSQPNDLTSSDAYLGAIASGLGSGVTLSTATNADNMHMSLRARGDIAFYTNTANPSLVERMRITTAGNVGIGTTNPVVKLQVEGGIRVNGSGISDAAYWNIQGGNGIHLSDGVPIKWSTSVGNSSNMVRLQGGKEAGVLNQANSTEAQTYRIYNTTDNNTGGTNFERASLGWGGNTFSIATEAGGTGSLRNIALMGGNVGIGTTTPQSKLDVAGGARVGADAVCSAAKAGMLAWNSDTLQVCTDAGTFTNIANSGGLIGGGGTPGGSADGQLQFKSGSSFAADAGLVYSGQTWNNVGTTFTGLAMDITDTASAAASKLLDLKVGGVSKTSIDKLGQLTVADGDASTYQGIRFSSTSLGFSVYAGGLRMGVLNNAWGMLYSSGFRLNGGVGQVYGWAPGTPDGSADTMLSRGGAANVQLGAADAAAPVAQTLSVQSVVAGTSNTAGVDFTIAGSQGTGTGTGGSILFKTAPAGTTGTTQNALATAMTILGNGNVGIGSASPISRLEVSTSANQSTDGLRVRSPSAGTITIAPDAAASNWNALTQTGDSIIVFTDGSIDTGALVIGPWGTGNKGIRIDSSGNLGVGVALPQSKLDVAGGARVGADAVCSVAKAGMLAWNSNTLQVCTEAGTFTDLATSGGISGSSQWVTTGNDIYYNTGNVGIGTTTPDSKFNVVNTFTGTATQNNVNIVTNVTPSSSQSTAINNRGFISYATIPSGNTTNVGRVRGASGHAENNANSGTTNWLMGIDGWAYHVGGATSNSVSGVAGSSEADSGNVNILNGLYSWTGAGGATVTNLDAVRGFADVWAGTVTNHRGAYLASSVTGGTVTNAYGLEISQGVSGSGVVSGNRYGVYINSTGTPGGTDYGIYQNTAAARNYFAGNVGIGTTAPGTMLHLHKAVSDAPAGGLAFSRYWNSPTDTRASAIYHYYNASGLIDGLVFATSQSNSPYDAAYARVAIDRTGKLGIGLNIAAQNPTLDLSFGGNNPRTIGMERSIIANSVGSNLTISAGGATLGGTDRMGGDLVLQSGKATGTGTSKITFQTYPAGASGTTDSTATTAMTIMGSGNVGIGTTAPQAKLHVGTGTVTGPSGLAVVSGTTTGGTELNMLSLSNLTTATVGNAAAISFNVGNGYGVTGKIATELTGLGGLSALKFSTYNGTLAERMRIDKDGNVGIGTTTPGYKLDLTGTTGTTAFAVRGSDITTPSFMYTPTSGGTGSLVLRNNGTTVVQIASNGSATFFNDGNVGIGTATPSEKLEVAGNVKATAYLNTSDRRLKDKIADIDGLQLIRQLRGVSFVWKDTGKEALGLIAQEVEGVLPYAVKTDANGMKSVDYIMMVAPMIEAIKSLDSEVTVLKAENAALKERVETLEGTVKSLEERLKAIEEKLGSTVH